MNIILMLGIILILGLLSTRISKKISLPNVTAFLVVGVLIGVGCLLIDQTGYICPTGEKMSESLVTMNSFISSVALGFIALSIGQEFKLSKIKEYGGRIITITLFQALSAVLLVDVALAITVICFGLNMSIAICLGAIATATAPAATIMVIRQYKAKGPLVDILLPVVAFDDAIGLIVFAISVSISKLFVGVGSVSVISILLIPLLEIFGSLAIGFILGILMHFVIKFFSSNNNHLIVMIAFTLLGVGIVIALNYLKINGESLNFSSLLTCMMIGAVYTNISKKEEIVKVENDKNLMDHWTPFLFTLFFVLSGSHLVIAGFNIFSGGEISLLLPIIIIFIVYIFFRSAGKYFGAFISCKIVKEPKEIQRYLGFTLLPQAGVAIGMANQISEMEVFKANHIGEIIVTVVLLATLLYEIVGPLLTKWSLNKAHEIDNENH